MDCRISLICCCSSSRLSALVLPPPDLQTVYLETPLWHSSSAYFSGPRDCGVQFSFPIMHTGPSLSVHFVLKCHSRPNQRPRLHPFVRPFPHVGESRPLGCAVRGSNLTCASICNTHSGFHISS